MYTSWLAATQHILQLAGCRAFGNTVCLARVRYRVKLSCAADVQSVEMVPQVSNSKFCFEATNRESCADPRSAKPSLVEVGRFHEPTDQPLTTAATGENSPKQAA